LAYARNVRQKWWSRRAFLLHSEFGFVVVACAVATWWQLGRALGGNFLSWFYTFEWPCIAAFAIAGWWHLIHEDPEAYRARKQAKPEWEDDEVDV
jgi:hypothetical protein